MGENEPFQEKTKKCPKCQEDIKIDAKKCKHCSSDLRNWFARHKILTGILIFFVIGYILGDSNYSSNNLNTSSGLNNTQQVNLETNKHETLSKKNAVRKAKSYLDIGGYSRSGLIDQLEYEGFPYKDAVYAVDYINVNWKEQAKRKAKSYLDIGGYSRSGLIDQLEYEGFTTEQATYGVNAIGL